MTRFAILALTSIAALLANYNAAHAADATARGYGPEPSQIASETVIFRLVVAQGQASILRQGTQATQTEEDLPVIADYSDLPGELWQLRPQVQDTYTRQ